MGCHTLELGRFSHSSLKAATREHGASTEVQQRSQLSTADTPLSAQAQCSTRSKIAP